MIHSLNFNTTPYLITYQKQEALPQSKCHQAWETTKKVSGFAIALFSDLLLLPFARTLLLVENALQKLKIDYNPTPERAKKDKPAIVLFHGSNYCQVQWVVARQFLKGDAFGSVYSVNYAEGLNSNNFDSGISDYASGQKLRDLLERVKKDTRQNRMIFIGHSMGSLVGECFAQYHAKDMDIHVTNVLSISTPWQGSPTIDLLKMKARRFQEMSHRSGAAEHLKFRKDLVTNAQQADRLGNRLHWNMWSKHDRAVPGRTGCLTDNRSRHFEVSAVGHYWPMFSLSMLLRMRSWVKQMYID